MKEPSQPSQDPQRLLISLEEAARRLSIGRSQLYQQMQSGMLRSVRIGRSRRILEQDLNEFVSQLLGDRDVVPQPLHRLPPARPVKAIPSRTGRR